MNELPTIIAEPPVHRMTQQALDALLATNDPPTLYRRGQSLVRLRLDTEIPSLQILGPDALRGVLDRSICWMRRTAGGELRPTRPDKDVVADILSLPDLSMLPALDGVITAPVYTADGRLLLAHGYHADSGLWLELGDLRVPPVPTRPTQAQVSRARGLLLEPLADFPLAESASRAHAVALMLLPFGRDLVAGPTPLHLVASPTQGSGKGLLVAVASVIATGTTPEVTTWPTTRGATDEAELRKRLWAHLLAGTRMIALDNVPTGLDSATLAAILTAETYADRTLGGSTVPSCPVRCVWAATGLNPTLTGELARRAISIRLEPSEEAPWERQGWRHADLLGWCREHRGELVWAALVLWRAWLAAGRPRWTEQTMGSYAAWSETMGGVLEVAGIPGLLGNRQDMWQATETELPELRALAENWWEEHGEAQVEVRDLVTLCKRRRILMDLLQGRRDKAKSLARLLRQHSGRVVDVGGLRLQMRLSGMTRTRTQLWRLARPLPAPHCLHEEPRQKAISGQRPKSSPAQSLHETLHEEPHHEAISGHSVGIAGFHVLPPAREKNIHGNRHGVDQSLQSLHPTPKPRQDANQAAGSGAGSAQGVEGSLPAKPAWMTWNQREQEQLEGLL